MNKQNDESVVTHDNKGVVPLNIRARNIMEPVLEELRPALPSTIPMEKFQAAFITAVVNNPEILQCKPTSIRTALMKCASDGLVPDGRAAALVPYKGVAQYRPMVKGLIDRAADLGDAFSITAEPVHEHDEFVVNIADPNDTKHTFGENPFQNRGEIIGAYAIFRTRDGVAIHRELMDRNDIDKARNVSAMKSGGIWNKWFGEMVRKTVIRRGIKYVPISPELRRIVERDDEYVDLNGPKEDIGNPLDEDELTTIIDAEAEEVEEMTDVEKEQMEYVLSEIRETLTLEDLFAWQSEFKDIIAQLHPTARIEVRQAIKEHARGLEESQ